MPHFFQTTQTNPPLLADRVDEAWERLTHEKDRAARKSNITFLKHVFDINEPTSEEEALALLTKYMALRNEKKEMNPNYLPVLCPDNASEYPSLVISDDIQRSDKANNIKMFSHEKRAELQLLIYQGFFCFNQKLFDTSKLTSHGHGNRVAFTMNLDFEISYFNHMGCSQLQNKLSHSSMNSGAPVLMAGEMSIKDGRLVSVSTHSGHYKPSEDSLIYFLTYLKTRQIDLSTVKALIHTPLVGEMSQNALELLNEASLPLEKMNGDDSDNITIAKLIEISNKYKADDKFTLEFGLRNSRKELMRSYQAGIQALIEIPSENTIERAFRMTKTYLAMNQNLSLNHYKNKENGRLNATFRKLETEIKKLLPEPIIPSVNTTVLTP